MLTGSLALDVPMPPPPAKGELDEDGNDAFDSWYPVDTGISIAGEDFVPVAGKRGVYMCDQEQYELCITATELPNGAIEVSTSRHVNVHENTLARQQRGGIRGWLKELIGWDLPRPPAATGYHQIHHATYLCQFGAREPAGRQVHSDAAQSPRADEGRLMSALKQAYAAREFEIDMYWKRAAYFWAFIASAFVAYAAFLSGDKPRAFPALLMSQVGLVFSVAWHRANQGSKFWQENWENHVDLLEDGITGPLYKTITQRPHQSSDEPTWIDRRIGPAMISVSKVNGIVSRYVIFLWAQLSIGAGVALWSSEIRCILHAHPVVLHLGRAAILVLVGGGSWLFVRQLRHHVATHRGPHQPIIWQRQMRPTDPE